MAAAPGGEDEATSSLRRPAGFDANSAFVVIEQIVDVGPFVGMAGGAGGNAVVFRADNLREEGDGHGVAGQAHEVVGGGVVDAGQYVALAVGDFEAVRVGVVRLVEVQPLRFQVHDAHEVRHRAGDIISNGHRSIVAGGQHQAVEQVAQC